MARKGTCTINSGKKTQKVQEVVGSFVETRNEIDSGFKEKPIQFPEPKTSVKESIAKMAQSAAQGIAKVPGHISKAATSVGEGVRKAAKTSKDGVTKASRSAGRGIAKIPGHISKAATSVGEGVRKAAKTSKDGVTKASRSTGRSIAKVPEHVTEAVQKTLFPSTVGKGVLHSTKELSATHLKYSPLHGLESNAVQLVSMTRQDTEGLSNELSATGSTANRHTRRLSAEQESASKQVGRAK
ncbi:hypothetical protein O998_00830 [Anaplasma phagocytophilum str. Norway variant1]|uniref:Uncharacterized protein n=1 Tax=Anaplasma phagocytophilum str. Norway variant1 TaxID=1392506 RepID=A0A7H9DY01_ANAPH|nr:hypothetical protein [Anaplasma phagocytophilum]QLL66444.1 hypothetical protein O998_00830 [Anaplasma phagocytophilum str. Norway variant1]